jgi:hypothetical protein
MEEHEIEIKEIQSRIETRFSIQNTPAYYCELCNYQARSASVYEQHMSTNKHTGLKPKKDYYCECCDYRATSKGNLDKHFASKKHQQVVQAKET